MRFKAINTIWAAIGMVFTFNSPIGVAADWLEAEQIYVQKLTNPQPNWLVVNDPNFLGNMDSKVLLMDVDSSRMLGMLSTGAWRNAVDFSQRIPQVQNIAIFLCLLGSKFFSTYLGNSLNESVSGFTAF